MMRHREPPPRLGEEAERVEKTGRSRREKNEEHGELKMTSFEKF